MGDSWSFFWRFYRSGFFYFFSNFWGSFWFDYFLFNSRNFLSCYFLCFYWSLFLSLGFNCFSFRNKNKKCWNITQIIIIPGFFPDVLGALTALAGYFFATTTYFYTFFAGFEADLDVEFYFFAIIIYYNYCLFFYI